MSIENSARHEPRSYSRWTRGGFSGEMGDVLAADIMCGPPLYAIPRSGSVELGEYRWTPDEARLIGVRLIEAAALADGDRAIREHRTT
jgi:hypothetical protein